MAQNQQHRRTGERSTLGWRAMVRYLGGNPGNTDFGRSTTAGELDVTSRSETLMHSRGDHPPGRPSCQANIPAHRTRSDGG
jgi:hypothetical protein